MWNRVAGDCGAPAIGVRPVSGLDARTVAVTNRRPAGTSEPPGDRALGIRAGDQNVRETGAFAALPRYRSAAISPVPSASSKSLASRKLADCLPRAIANSPDCSGMVSDAAKNGGLYSSRCRYMASRQFVDPGTWRRCRDHCGETCRGNARSRRP